MTIRLFRRMTVTAVAMALLSVPLHAAFSPSEASAAPREKLHFRGMTLTLPAGWEAERLSRDYVQVRPKGCDPVKKACANFHVVGPRVLKGGEMWEKYETSRPFAPGTGVPPCRFTPKSIKYGERFTASKPAQRGHRPVGRGHRAEYRVWKGECYKMTSGKRYKTFKQREWYLPKSKILIVDGWDVPGLADIVARATWK